MSSPKDKEIKRASIACTNCRSKKLRCRADEGKKCHRCISEGVHCEYVPVSPSPTTPNDPHHQDLPLILQLPHQPQGFPPSENTHHLTQQPVNIQWHAPNSNAISNIDHPLMARQGVVGPTTPALGNYSSGQVHPVSSSQSPPVHAAIPVYSPPYHQSHGHQGPYSPRPQLTQQQYGHPQAPPSMGQAPHYSQGMPQAVSGYPPTGSYYQQSNYTGPTSSSHQDYSYFQAKGDPSKQ